MTDTTPASTKTGARRLEGTLLPGEQMFRIVEETTSDAIITIDEASEILFVNRAAEKIFGYEAGEMLGHHLTMLMPEYLRHLHEAGLNRYVETGHRHISWEGVELPGLHKSGRELTLEISFGEFTEDGKHFFTGIARDISERKRGQRRLDAQHAVTRILAEATTLDDASLGVLRVICENLRWQVGLLWGVDYKANVLRCVNVWHDSTAQLAEFESTSRRRTFSPGVGLPGRVWMSRDAAWITDVVVNGNFPRAQIAAKEGLHGAFAFPVLLGKEVLGIMEFFSREAQPPDENLLAAMANIGSQVGQYMERKRAEEERTGLQEQIIGMQQALLAELSTPLIPISDKVVIMPLIGQVDAQRAEQMLDTLLRGIESRQAQIAIVDITGVPTVDNHVANMLIHAAQAVRLIGAQVVLTGIRPDVAQAFVRLGVDLRGIITHSNLKSGIIYALNHINAR